MSVMIRKTYHGAALSLRMGCGEQLLTHDSLWEGRAATRPSGTASMQPKQANKANTGRRGK